VLPSFFVLFDLNVNDCEIELYGTTYYLIMCASDNMVPHSHGEH